VSGIDVRKRAIYSALLDLGEAFIPSDDRPENLDRRRRVADQREQVDKLGDWTVSDDVMIEALWSATLIGAQTAMAALKLAGEINDELAEAFDELDRITNARTRRNVERAAELRGRAVELRKAGEKIAVIANILHRSDRWVYGSLPEDMKPRR